MANRNYLRVAVRFLTAFVCFVILPVLARSNEQSSTDALPVVISAAVPIYPRLARETQIEGIVNLRVTTDGNKASRIDYENGPAMLARAAQENINTWKFQEHKPTSFEATFRYKFLPDGPACADDADTNDATVLLKLPSEAEITARALNRCDPLPDLTKPSAVSLEVHLNGKKISPPKVITLMLGDHTLEIPVQGGIFRVPPEFLQAKSVDFGATIKDSRILVPDIYGGKLADGSLVLVLEDRHFSKEFDYADIGSDARSTCVLQFVGGEPGTVEIATHCRSKLKK
jgi:Gram-negative bacterial TonB protein C-terminal